MTDDPSIQDFLRGAAHGLDLARKWTTGTDPKTRVAVEHLDRISLQDALDHADRAIQSDTQNPDPPMVDTRDAGGDGMDVLVDTAGTPVKPEHVVPELSPDGKLELTDPSSRWTATVQTNVGDGRLESSVSGDVLTVSILRDVEADETDAQDDATEQESDDTHDEEESDTDDSDGDMGDSGTGSDGGADSGGDSPPTVEEFVEENPWVREALGEENVEMALSMVGEMPADEALGMLRGMSGE